MGAAIPLAMTLALAIQDNLPCPNDSTDRRIYTGSEECVDKVVPSTAGEDSQYQMRVISTVFIRLSAKQTARAGIPADPERAAIIHDAPED
jgi:hypothetical protein